MSNKNEIYYKLQEASNKHGETNDCGVIAVAAAVNVPYAVAHGALTRHGRRARRGTTVVQINAAVNDLGYKLIRRDLNELRNKIPYYYRPKYLTPNSVRRFNSIWDKDRTFIALTTSHALTIRNGEVLDWTDGRKHRIVALFEVVRNEESA